MSEIIEISRRCELGEDSGIACGPVSMTAVCAEMEIEEDGKRKFLICEWCDAASDSVSFEVTNESIFDIMTLKDDDMDKLEKLRNDSAEEYVSCNGDYEGKYPEQFKNLVQMVKDKIASEELYDPDDFEDGVIDLGF